MLIDPVHRVELADERQGGLFADACHAGDIVRAVPHQRLDLDQFPGSHTVLLLDLCHAVEGAFGASHLGGGKAYGGGIAHQLQAVPVSGGDDALIARILTQPGQGAQNIVGLIAFAGHHRIAQLLQQILEIGQLHCQFVGHAMASGLVFGVELVPEGGRLEVEGKGNRIRGSFLTDLQKDGEKAIDAVGIDAILGGERAHAVVSPVEYAVGVDGEQLHTCKILSLNGIIAAGRLLRFIFMAGRSAGFACSRPNGRLYHFADASWYNNLYPCRNRPAPGTDR